MPRTQNNDIALCDRERALGNFLKTDGTFPHLGTATITAEELMVLDWCILWASTQMRRRCGRDFAQIRYDQCFSVNDGHRDIFLKNPPIQHVERVMTNLTTVLDIENTSSSVDQAEVEISDTAVLLHRVASGTMTTNESTFASNATITALETAIDAVANGWSATATSGYTTWPSVDLMPMGRTWAKNPSKVSLKLHTEGCSFDLDERLGVLTNPYGWPRGNRNVRVIWTGGFADVPHDVQGAVAEWAAAIFGRTGRDPGLIQESRPGFHFIAAQVGPPPSVHEVVQSYKIGGSWNV